MAQQKDCRFYFRLTGDDREILDELSEAMGVTPSGVIRMLLRREHRAIRSGQPSGEQPAPAAAPVEPPTAKPPTKQAKRSKKRRRKKR